MSDPSQSGPPQSNPSLSDPAQVGPVTGRGPRVLTIAGLDPCGGAGVLADAATIRRLDGDPCAAVTCLTVQNRHGFRRADPVGGELLGATLQAIEDDEPLDAIKVGMLGSVEVTRVVADFVAQHAAGIPVVVDPVLSSTAPGYDGSSELAEAIRDCLLPHAALVTPNLDEMTRLGGEDRLLDVGCALLTTDGDGPAGGVVRDRLTLPGELSLVFENPRIDRQRGVHGTGCALSTTLAVLLARGESLVDACRVAIAAIRERIRRTPDGVATSDTGADPIR